MMVVTVAKIGDGTADDPFHPDTTATWWQVIEERDTEFLIEIFN